VWFAAGSDDGLVHVTQDNGVSWQNWLTPATLPEWLQINRYWGKRPFDPAGGLFSQQLDIKTGGLWALFVFKTKDYGKTGLKISCRNSKLEHFTRVVRLILRRRYAVCGRDCPNVLLQKMMVRSWHFASAQLTIVSITDLAIKDNNLIAAYPRCAFWITWWFNGSSSGRAWDQWETFAFISKPHVPTVWME